ncbi:MAG: hypothetical protein R3C46_04310 [Hyphomonadaceae bacterium]
MKKYVVTASLAAGLSMISGAAFAQTGSAGVNYTRIDTDFGDADAYGIDGEVVIPTGGSWSAILEGSYNDGDNADGTLAGRAHLVNFGENNAWGGYVGLADGDGSTVYGLGGEYAQFFDASTLALNLNYLTDDDSNVDFYSVGGAYRIFASDNLRFDVTAMLGRADSSGGDADVNSIGVGLEYMFDNSPFSVGASYQRLDGDIAEANVFGVTLRMNFGGDTLKAADRKGKSFTGSGNIMQMF